MKYRKARPTNVSGESCTAFVVTLPFPTVTIFFWRRKQNACLYIHSPYVPDMTRAYLLPADPGGEKFAVLYMYTVQLSSPSRACVASIFPPLGIVFDPYTHHHN